MLRFNINDADVVLQDDGWVIISHQLGKFSYQWNCGDQGMKLFFHSIDKQQFVDKLKPDFDCPKFDGKKTFENVKNFFKEQFYFTKKEAEFEKEFWDALKEFENDCMLIRTDHYFIENWKKFINRLDIPTNRLLIEFNHIGDCSRFIEKCESDEVKFLNKLWVALKKELRKS